jgi:MarR family transcriptional regulator for hemolysin
MSEIGLLLGPAYYRLRMVIEAGLAQMGLAGVVEPGMGPLLFMLEAAGELPLHQLVERTGLTKGTITNQVKAMERNGLVLRRAEREDRRVVLVRLSPGGRKTMPLLHALRRRIQAHLVVLAGADSEACARALARIARMEQLPIKQGVPAVSRSRSRSRSRPAAASQEAQARRRRPVGDR